MMSTFGTTLDSIEARELINRAKGYTEEELADELADTTRVITFGSADAEAKWRITNVELPEDGVRFRLEGRDEAFDVGSNLIGSHNIHNLTGAILAVREFGLTPEEIDEAYEKNTGLVIIETFETRGIKPMYTPAVLCANHGPFTWGKDAAQAVYHAVVLEEVAKMALLTCQINPNAEPAPQHVLDKHFMRKHGPNAYYGQKK